MEYASIEKIANGYLVRTPYEPTAEDIAKQRIAIGNDEVKSYCATWNDVITILSAWNG